MFITKKRHEREMRELKAAAARDITAEQKRNETLAETVASLRPDAEKWRDYLKRARDRKASKKGRA